MTPLPGRLAEAIGDLTAADLRPSARALREAYRAGRPAPLNSFEDAAAYAAYRMPATYAATVTVLRAVVAADPRCAPSTLVDVGAGPGTAAWAACEVFGPLDHVTCVEPNAHMRRVGERLAGGRFSWAPDGSPTADLVVAAYSVGEGSLDVTELWRRAVDTLVIVEPGTPRGFAAVIAARTTLIENGGHVVAPCPHDDACPMPSPGWCHFGVRLPRTAIQRELKDAALGYEDEKYSYVAVTRRESASRVPRVIDHPRYLKHRVSLSLCTTDGLRKRDVPRSAESYRAARKLRWGDVFSG